MRLAQRRITLRLRPLKIRNQRDDLAGTLDKRCETDAMEPDDRASPLAVAQITPVGTLYQPLILELLLHLVDAAFGLAEPCGNVPCRHPRSANPARLEVAILRLVEQQIYHRDRQFRQFEDLSARDFHDPTKIVATNPGRQTAVRQGGPHQAPPARFGLAPDSAVS